MQLGLHFRGYGASMHIDAVSSGAKANHNEDWVCSFHTPGTIDLVIIDGGTSVADVDYIDRLNGDVVWFVTRFAASLGACIESGLGQHAAVHAAIGATYDEFRERAAGQEIPEYAWPIAAMTWLRLTTDPAATRLSMYCLGDCKVLMHTPGGEVRDLDPWVNPQEAVLSVEVAKLQAEGLQDSAARHARLLPILRARREFQNAANDPEALCLRPNGQFRARTIEVDVPNGASVLAMTDGFYRLVDTYGLHTPESLFALCEQRGLQPALDELRQYEAAAPASASSSVKRADDASAILWRAGPA